MTQATITIQPVTINRPGYVLAVYRCAVCEGECAMRVGAMPPVVDGTHCPHQWKPVMVDVGDVQNVRTVQK